MTASDPSASTARAKYSGGKLSEPVGGNSTIDDATPGLVVGATPGAVVGAAVGGSVVGGVIGAADTVIGHGTCSESSATSMLPVPAAVAVKVPVRAAPGRTRPPRMPLLGTAPNPVTVPMPPVTAP